jgi:hypothetical protein
VVNIGFTSIQFNLNHYQTFFRIHVLKRALDSAAFKFRVAKAFDLWFKWAAWLRPIS